MNAQIEITPFLRAYVVAALWSTNDESTPQGGEPLDSNYSIDDIAPDTLASMAEDCAKFLRENEADIAKGCTRGTGEFTAEEQAGHDFWLTRCGHGAGFWDGDWRDGEDRSREERLTEAAQAFGNVDLYVGDDGKIHS